VTGTVSYDFTDNTVIVTGAAQGIGFEVAAYFARAHANVFVIDFDEAGASAAAEQIGATAIRCDVSNTDDVDAAVAAVVAKTGRVDVLVNNAGILRDKVSWKLTDDDWDAVMAVHVGGTYRFTRACVPHFRAQSGGRVINVTSYSGLHGNTGQANYSTAKAGIIGFTKAVAKEVAGFGVTVNAISPNAETAMIASIPDEKRAAFISWIPLGRIAEASEIPPTIAFLASDAANYITGAVIPVDGGMSM